MNKTENLCRHSHEGGNLLVKNISTRQEIAAFAAMTRERSPLLRTKDEAMKFTNFQIINHVNEQQ